MMGIGLGDGTTSSWNDVFKDTFNVFAQAGAKILTNSYGSTPVYTSTAGPYGQTTSVYQPGVSVPGSTVPVAAGSALSSTGVLLLAGGAVLLIALMGRK